MGRDGMIPPLFHKLNPRTLTPVPATIIVAVVISLLAGRAADRLPRRDDEHRHARRVPDRLDRRDGAAPDGSPTCRAASRSRSIRSSRSLSIARLHLDHPGPARGDDLRLLRLGRRGAGLVLRSTAGTTPRARAGGTRHAMSLLVGFAPDGRGQRRAAPRGHARALGRRRPRRLRGRPRALAAEPGAGGRRVPGSTCSDGGRGAGAGARAAARRHARPRSWSTTRARCRPACSRWPSSATRALIVVGSSPAGGAGQVDARQREQPAAAQLADPGRAGAARVPLPRRTRGVARVTAAFGGTESAENLVIAAAGVAARVGATLRLASFAVRPRAPYTVGVGTRGRRGDGHRVDAPRSRRPGAPRSPRSATCRRSPRGAARSRSAAARAGRRRSRTSSGTTATCSSSARARSARSRGCSSARAAAKIVRHSPVPVVVVPRGAAAELAEAGRGGRR